jgi:DnaK suppressor protein
MPEHTAPTRLSWSSTIHPFGRPADGLVERVDFGSVTSADRAGFREKLNAIRDEILREGDVELEPGRTDDTAVGTDEDAQPLTEMSQTIASNRNRERASILRLVSTALARLEGDPEMFGLCVECEEPIPSKRLALLPYVELCVECQQSRDRKRGGRRKGLTDFR